MTKSWVPGPMLMKEMDGTFSCVVIESGDAEVLHVLLGEDVDAQGNVLKVLFALARGDDDFLQHGDIRGLAAVRVRRRDGECGGYGETDLGDGGGATKRRAPFGRIVCQHHCGSVTS